jgi:hypothetical protein
MTLGEDLCRKYALTSFKVGSSLTLMAINEALEAAAEIAEQEKATNAAARIRSLKWESRKTASSVQDVA